MVNQKSWQNASRKVEKDFYKLLNNSNFGIDCRNNIDNCYLDPIYDDIDEIGCIKKYANIPNNQNYRDFFSLDKNDPEYEAKLAYLERKNAEDLDAVHSFEKNAIARKRKFETIEEKIRPCADPRKTKMLIEFNDAEAASIKSIAVKKKSVVKATTRFMSGKSLMFAKLSLKSFIYSLVEIFSFSNEIVQEIYKKYQIEKNIVLPYFSRYRQHFFTIRDNF